MSSYIDVPLDESESQKRGMFPVEHMHILEDKEGRVFLTWDYETFIHVDMTYDSCVKLISDKKKVAKGRRKRKLAKPEDEEKTFRVI